MDLFELIENLKDPSYVEQHSIIKLNLNSFEYPKTETKTITDK